MSEPTYTLDQLMQMIRYTRHSKANGRQAYETRDSLLTAFGRACKLFEDTHSNKSLRDEYVHRRNSNSLTKEFLDRIFPYFPSVTNFEGKPLKIIDYSLATNEADPKPTVPPIDLRYTAKVVEASTHRELEKALALPFTQIAQSTEAFPVDFDHAWEWIGYSTKGNAKRKLEADFLEGVDYLFIHNDKNSGDTGRPLDRLFLTIDCFKQFCMMAGTERGKQVRLYYLDIEKRFKSREYNAITTPPAWAADIMTRLANVSESLGGNIISVKTDVDALKAGHEDHEKRLRQIELDKQSLVIYVAQCSKLGYIKIGYTQKSRVMERLAEINLQRRVDLKLLMTQWCDDAHRRELDLHDRWKMFRVKPAAAWGREFYYPVQALADWLIQEGCEERIFVQGQRPKNGKKASGENITQMSIL